MQFLGHGHKELYILKSEIEMLLWPNPVSPVAVLISRLPPVRGMGGSNSEGKTNGRGLWVLVSRLLVFSCATLYNLLSFNFTLLSQEA